MAFELIPYESIKNFLGLDGSSINDYPSLGTILDRLLPSFEAFTGREFEKIERIATIFMNEMPKKMIYLPAIPIEEVVSVEAEEYGSVDYKITGYGLRLETGISNDILNVTYTGGLESVTPVLEAAALYQLSHEFNRKEHIGAETVSTEGGTVTYRELGLLKETKRILMPAVHPLKTDCY